VVTARRLPQLEEVEAACLAANKEGGTGKGGKALSLSLDMRDRKAIDEIIPKIKESGFPPIDILVNNAGLVHGVDQVGEINEDDIDVMLETNVRGLIRLTQIVVKGECSSSSYRPT
jgi:3-hydroxy acid dehydrogenase / malonic semialdehyde reductase